MTTVNLIRRGSKNDIYSIPEDGLRFGRSTINDMPLKDRELPLFLGRFFFHKNENVPYVEIFSKDSLLLVDGITTDYASLSDGQCVTIGSASFDVQIEQTAQRAPTRRRCSGKYHPHIPAFAAGILILLTLSGTAFLLRDPVQNWLVRNKNIAAPSHALDYVKKNDLTLLYQRLRGDSDHMIRYAIELESDGTLSAQIHDLNNNMVIERSQHLSPKEQKALETDLRNAGYFKAPAQSAAVCSTQGNYTLMNIILEHNERYHETRVFNGIMPIFVKQSVRIIEEVSMKKLQICQLWNMSLPETKEYIAANGVLDENAANHSITYFDRLNATIHQLNDAQDYLKTLEACPLSDEINRATQTVQTRFESEYQIGKVQSDSEREVN